MATKKGSSKKGVSKTDGASTTVMPLVVAPEDLDSPVLFSRDQVFALATSALAASINASAIPVKVIVSDNTYFGAPPLLIDTLSRSDPILSTAAYRDEVFDCDDYVQYLKVQLSLWAARKKLNAPLAVGYLLTQRHAFNICVAPDNGVVIFNTESKAKAYTASAPEFVGFLEVSPYNPIQLVYF